MGHMLIRYVAILLLLAALVSAVAQTTAHPGAQTPANSAKQTASPKPPDMVCWGSGPDWSIQFASWGARYLGINEPDQDFLGAFYWVPKDRVWAWHRTDGFTSTNGNDLSAIIKEASCTDPVRKETFPYSAQVNLAQGGIVNGCCRKLKAGEAPVGPHGVLPQQ